MLDKIEDELELLKKAKVSYDEISKVRKKLKNEAKQIAMLELFKKEFVNEYKGKYDISFYKLPRMIKIWPVVPDSNNDGLGSLDMENVEYLNFTKENGLEISTGGDWQNAWYVRISYDLDNKKFFVADFKPMEMMYDKFKSKDKKKRLSIKELTEMVVGKEVIEATEKIRKEEKARMKDIIKDTKEDSLVIDDKPEQLITQGTKNESVIQSFKEYYNLK